MAVEYEHRWRADRQRAEQESRSDERNRLTEDEQSLAEQERSEESSDCEVRAQLVCEAATAWQDLTRKLFEHPGGPD